MTRKILFLIPVLVCIFPASFAARQGQSQDAVRQEEAEDYYQKWLEEDVRYIISPEEKAVFESLTTSEEKEQFIEQFWFRRDPDPRTPENEFKEEHYRRIAYANDAFWSGKPGWLTDRGRMYILHGPPDEIESHPSGGTYARSPDEGGGFTATYPFEVWRYRQIDGLGSDVVLEFVDPTFSGEYRLSLNPEEKDALLHVPNAGLLLSEEAGVTKKTDRPYFSPGNRNHPLLGRLSGDTPFARYERYARVQRPPEIKHKDLKQIVSVDVQTSSVPVQLHADYFRLDDHQALVPVTVQVPNRELSFEREAGVYVARFAVYGVVTSLNNRIVAEFEDTLVTSYTPQQIDAGLRASSVYQKIVALELRNRYKLDLVLKDVRSGKVGVTHTVLVPPSFDQDSIQTSSLLLSNQIRQLAALPDEPEMFVLGDIKIRPNLTHEFPVETALGVYFQAYNFATDQSSFEPSLRIQYDVSKGGEPVSRTVDEQGESVQYYSGQRAVIVKVLSLAGLAPGTYHLTVQVTDLLTDRSSELEGDFVVVDPKRMASR